MKNFNKNKKSTHSSYMQDGDRIIEIGPKEINEIKKK